MPSWRRTAACTGAGPIVTFDSTKHQLLTARSSGVRATIFRGALNQGIDGSDRGRKNHWKFTWALGVTPSMKASTTASTTASMTACMTASTKTCKARWPLGFDSRPLQLAARGPAKEVWKEIQMQKRVPVPARWRAQPGRRLFVATGLWLAGALCAGAAQANTVVVNWNQAALQEVRLGRLGPPIVARALALAHTCMYDAWAAYDSKAIGTVLGAELRRPAAERSEANKSKAISVAAYRCLVNLFPAGTARLQATLRGLGHDPNNLSTDRSTPQGIGNVAAQAVIDSRRNDGANQYGNLAPGPYGDYTGYAPRNAPLPFCTPLTVGPCPPNIANPYTWQPLISDTGSVQRFIAPHWENVKPFALASATVYDNRPDITPAPNYLRNPGAYQQDVEEMLRNSADLDPQRKLIVEYWADGPASELPPGHWGLFAQFVSQRHGHTIDQDAKLFFAMHNASFDAGIVAWHLKRKYDGVRPITAVRYLKQGKSVTAWGGPGQPTGRIDGEKWTPYNPGSNLTPAFAGYISGHSTFSSASAAILRQFTGSDNFGFSTVIPPNFGRVEPGVPSVPTALGYATFSAATADAGASRLYGGIHFSDDNTVGQNIGALVAAEVWAKAQFLFDGGLSLSNATSVNESQSSQVVWRHTVQPVQDRLLLVGVSYTKGKEPVEGVYYGNSPMRLLGSSFARKNENRVELWYMTSPPVGTANVVVNMAKKKDVVGGAMSFAGVDQTAPFGTFRWAADQSEEACVTLANAPADLVASVVSATGRAGGIRIGVGQRQAWGRGTGNGKDNILGSAVTLTGSPMATICQGLDAAEDWSLVAVPLRPSVGR
jgi:membrane-associated phospholipid phosphatase